MLSAYQNNTLETLFRQAVKLSVNAAGGPGLCELGCGRIGSQAHHVVHRSQEPSLRLLYEPRFAVLLCGGCHVAAHQAPLEFYEKLVGVLGRTNRPKARWLTRYHEIHDHVKPAEVSWQWMCAYLKRCIERSCRHWADAYNRDVVYD